MRNTWCMNPMSTICSYNHGEILGSGWFHEGCLSHGSHISHESHVIIDISNTEYIRWIEILILNQMKQLVRHAHPIRKLVYSPFLNDWLYMAHALHAKKRKQQLGFVGLWDKKEKEAHTCTNRSTQKLSMSQSHSQQLNKKDQHSFSDSWKPRNQEKKSSKKFPNQDKVKHYSFALHMLRLSWLDGGLWGYR